jgi:nitrate reductase gamma subunit
MNEPAGSFVFRVWPYLALVLAGAGFAVRMLVTSDRLPVVRRVLPHAKRVFLGGWPWRAAWVLLVAVHVAVLLFPRTVLAWNRAPGRLLALEAIGFCVGLAVLAALIRSVWLHLRRPSRGGWSLVSDLADSVFLSLLFIGVSTGLLAAGVHRWGSAWGAVTMAPYAASLVHGRPVAALVEHMPLLIRLHLFAAFAAIAVFPATRLATFPLIAGHRALAFAGRMVAAAARPARAWVHRGPAAWLWPEPEVRWLTKPRPDGGRRPPDKTPAWWQRLGRDGRVDVKHTGGKAV